MINVVVFARFKNMGEGADMETDMMIKPDDLKTLDMYSAEPTDGITFGCG